MTSGRHVRATLTQQPAWFCRGQVSDRYQARLVFPLANGEVGLLFAVLPLGLDDQSRLGGLRPAGMGDEIHVVLHRRRSSLVEY